MHPSLSIRAISPADAPQVLALMRAKANEDGVQAEFSATEATLQSIPEKVAVLVAVATDTSIVAYITYSFVWSLYANRDFVWLDDLYVRESGRRRGVAKKLMRAMCDHARMVGAHR